MTQTVRFGRYTLDRRIAIGGMAEVFLARFEGPGGFEKKVVVKRLLPHLQRNSQFVEMFLDEARLAARFNHQNLVQIYELAKIGDDYAVIMEYIEGKDLAEILDRSVQLARPIPETIVAAIIAACATGLHYVHEFGGQHGEPLNVVHRDISPTNIIVTWRGGVKIVDFGIAKHEGALAPAGAGTLKGKIPYMSPEQAHGKPVDRRSDLFSLGAVFYELLTLKPCFTGDSYLDVLDAVSSVKCKAARSLRSELAPELESVLGKMLVADPDGRFPTAQDVEKRLRRFIAARGEDVNAEVRDFVEGLYKGQPRLTGEIPRRIATAVYDAGQVPVAGDLADPSRHADAQSYRDVIGQHARRLEAQLRAKAVTRRDDLDLEYYRSLLEDIRRKREEETLGARLRRIAARPYTRVAALAAMLSLLVLALVRVSPRMQDTGPAPTRVRPAPGDGEDVAVTPDGAGTGLLSLTSEPRMEVMLNDERLGQTPLRDIGVPAGKLTLVLRHPEQRFTRRVELTVPRGGTVNRRVVLEKGTVQIEAKPAAQVFLGGKRMGKTPLTLSLYEGEHTLRLAGPGKQEKEVRVSVQPGRTRHVSARLP